MAWGWERDKREIHEELESHLKMAIAERVERGEDPKQARAAALREFGNLVLVEEVTWERRSWLWLENLMRDIRFAARSLKAVRGYTATLVCTLALGLGCVATMFAIVHCVLLRPVDLPQPRRLVQVYAEDETQGFTTTPRAISYAAIGALRRNMHSFAGVGGYNTMVLPVDARDGTRVSPLLEVTPGFLQLLGVSAKAGRLIGPEDGTGQVADVSYEFWRDRLESNPNAIGSAITIAGKQWTVIGILPEGFHAPGMIGSSLVFLPIEIGSSGEDAFNIESAAVIGRLKNGVSIDQARAEGQSIFVNAGGNGVERQRLLKMRSYQDLVAADMQQPLWALLGGALVLLLIACANAANLQIGRTASRMPEMTVRSALGAGWGRLMQQLVIENVIASLLGAALGGGLAYLAVAAVRHAYASEYPRFDEIAVHPLVWIAECVLALAVAVLASVAPALNVRREAVGHFRARSATGNSRLPGLLVAVQVALTCVLLVTTGLFVRTLQSLENVDLGFDPHGITSLVLMPKNQHQDPQLSREIETHLLHRFETLPGIESVTAQSQIPFSSYDMTLHGTTDVSGRAYRKGDLAYYSFVSTNFVRTSGIRLLKGRGFAESDESSGVIVVLVNEAFLKMFLNGRESLNETLRFHRDPGDKDEDLPFTQSMTVVGIVQNEIQGGDLGASYQPMVYIDYLALPKASFLSAVFSMTAQYAVRSALPEATVAAEVRSVLKQEAPTMVEMSLGSMEEDISKSLGQRRLALRLVAGFGIVALILSAVGIYGVLAYSVALRRREIGIRMALGSNRQRAAGLVMSQAGRMVLLGLIPGIAGAWAAGYGVRSFLYGVHALDAEAVAGAGAALLLVASVATFVPAIRAAQVDPVETLRTD
jgi:predicted permease